MRFFMILTLATILGGCGAPEIQCVVKEAVIQQMTVERPKGWWDFETVQVLTWNGRETLKIQISLPISLAATAPEGANVQLVKQDAKPSSLDMELKAVVQTDGCRGLRVMMSGVIPPLAPAHQQSTTSTSFHLCEANTRPGVSPACATINIPFDKNK